MSELTIAEKKETVYDLESKMNRLQTKEFEDMIKYLLSRAKLGEKTIKTMTTPKYLSLFRQAFIHRSASANTNYEQYEFLGDALLKYCQTRYLTRRFPSLKNEDILTRIRSDLEKTKTLGKISRRLGFDSYIVASEYMNANRNSKLQEDVFEAFLGVIGIVIDDVANKHASPIVVYHLVESLMNEIEINTDLMDVKDPKSQLKELYNKKDWGMNPDFIRKELENGEHRIEVYHPETSTLMGFGENRDLKIAEMKASKMALEFLSSRGEYSFSKKEYESSVKKLEDIFSRLNLGLPVYKRNYDVKGKVSLHVEDKNGKIYGSAEHQFENKARKYAASTTIRKLYEEKKIWKTFSNY